ncbi:MAG: hypothetical protein V4637_19995 [Pseudomonadota bacterium]
MPIEIAIVGALRALMEVAGLVLLLRGVMWLLGSRAGSGNVVYDIFSIAATPFTRLSRRLMPRRVADRYIPAIAFLLVLMLWLGLALGQQALCVDRGVKCI